MERLRCFHMGCAATSWVVLLPQGLGCYHRVWAVPPGSGQALALALALAFVGGPPSGRCFWLFGQALPAFRGGGAAPTRVCCFHMGCAAATGFGLLSQGLGCTTGAGAGFGFCFAFVGGPPSGRCFWLFGQAVPAIAAGAPLPQGPVTPARCAVPRRVLLPQGCLIHRGPRPQGILCDSRII